MPTAPIPVHPLLTTEPIEGGCDVIIFHPRHDLTLARLDKIDIEKIIEAWIGVYLKRGSEEGIQYVQIFEVAIVTTFAIAITDRTCRTKAL